MKAVHGMFTELAAAGWCVIAMNYLPSVGGGDWRISAEKKVPPGLRESRWGHGSTIHEAVKVLYLECLGEEWE